jgi:hypothetical protein
VCFQILIPVGPKFSRKMEVDASFQPRSERIGTGSTYFCTVCEADPLVEEKYRNTNNDSIYTHIRIRHTGVALGCRFCLGFFTWSADNWKDHMARKHHKEPLFLPLDEPAREEAPAAAEVAASPEEGTPE